MGAVARKVARSPNSNRRLRTKDNDRTTVLVIDTDPLISTEAGGTGGTSRCRKCPRERSTRRATPMSKALAAAYRLIGHLKARTAKEPARGEDSPGGAMREGRD
jgi:TPP-dependent trihydroxycyclohexane-1,2-dione (THcHDO) dehydratase